MYASIGCCFSRRFSQHAVLSSVIVIKDGFLNPKGLRLNLGLFLTRANFAGNMVLEPENIVYVPKNFTANVNYFVIQMIGPIASGAQDVYQATTLQ